MSRDPHDRYYTPRKPLRSLLDLVPIRGQVWEPCAGDGEMARWIGEQPGVTRVWTSDLHEPPQPAQLTLLGTQQRLDALGDWASGQHRERLRTQWGAPDWIVTNPPYSDDQARLFTHLALQECPRVVMLLRLSFLEYCQTRRDLLDQLGCVIEVGRVRWRGPGGDLHPSPDTTPSGWFVWGWRPATGPVVLWGER